MSQVWSERTLVLTPKKPPWSEDHSAAVMSAAGGSGVNIEVTPWSARVDLSETVESPVTPPEYFTFLTKLRASDKFVPMLINLELSLNNTETEFGVPLPEDTTEFIEWLENRARAAVQ
eukprot:TRINITY_DN12754_c0_g1_i1.p1 TRINITY_DN12754_c0_g1~~TRINITY_DN12754_c0_g1_i1.p1  ORF type:complete len:118 (+),score=21.86 TRINITY_DN12754_c0_g1_i1:52-405(+)